MPHPQPQSSSVEDLGDDEYLNDLVAGDSDSELVRADIEDSGDDDEDARVPPKATKRKADQLEANDADDDNEDGGEAVAGTVKAEGTAASATTTPAGKPDATEKKKKKKKKKVAKDYSINQAALLDAEGIPHRDCSDFTQKAGDETLVAFIRDYLFKNKSSKLFSAASPLAVGSPKAIIISGSAIRAAHLARLVRACGTCKVAKLFAKHFKIAEQTRVLNAEVFPLAVGTAGRVLALLKNGALKVDELDFLIMDGTYRDEKQRTLFDVPENKPEILALLKAVREASPETQICIY
ncbi:cms1 ribosomal small subunit [Geranomyces variabilis]|nr:cms1 ribosomal small subunit [Geranomyces variabilis]